MFIFLCVEGRRQVEYQTNSQNDHESNKLASDTNLSCRGDSLQRSSTATFAHISLAEEDTCKVFPVNVCVVGQVYRHGSRSEVMERSIDLCHQKLMHLSGEHTVKERSLSSLGVKQ